MALILANPDLSPLRRDGTGNSPPHVAEKSWHRPGWEHGRKWARQAVWLQRPWAALGTSPSRRSELGVAAWCQGHRQTAGLYANEICPQEANPQSPERSSRKTGSYSPRLGKLRNEQIIKKETRAPETKWDHVPEPWPEMGTGRGNKCKALLVGLRLCSGWAQKQNEGGAESPQ